MPVGQQCGAAAQILDDRLAARRTTAVDQLGIGVIAGRAANRRSGPRNRPPGRGRGRAAGSSQTREPRLHQRGRLIDVVGADRMRRIAMTLRAGAATIRRGWRWRGSSSCCSRSSATSSARCAEVSAATTMQTIATATTTPSGTTTPRRVAIPARGFRSVPRLARPRGCHSRHALLRELLRGSRDSLCGNACYWLADRALVACDARGLRRISRHGVNRAVNG